MPDEMKQEADQAQQESVKVEQTPSWSIVATLVVPVRPRDDMTPWPPSDMWKTGPWPGNGRWKRPEENRGKTYGNEALASLIQAQDRRWYLADTEENRSVGKFKVECVELVALDSRNQWGLVHLSIDDLDFKSLETVARNLKSTVRLTQTKYSGVDKLNELLYPAQPDISTGSRASAVVLLAGDEVKWSGKVNLLSKALNINPSFTFVEGTLLSTMRHAKVGLHGILIESNSSGVDNIKWHLQGVYAEQVLIARYQKEAVKEFVGKVATLFDEGAGIKADELVRQFYRWRARSWWSDLSVEETATLLLRSYQTALRLPEIVNQLSGEMADYAAIAQEDAAKATARSSNLFARTATIFTVIAVPATVGFTGAEVLGWHGMAGFFGALGVTVVGAVLIVVALWVWGRLRRLRTDWRTGQSLGEIGSSTVAPSHKTGPRQHG